MKYIRYIHVLFHAKKIALRGCERPVFPFGGLGGAVCGKESLWGGGGGKRLGEEVLYGVLRWGDVG
jgi:hypothetical protein